MAPTPTWRRVRHCADAATYQIKHAGGDSFALGRLGSTPLTLVEGA
ncbi:MAG: hypothetical protein ACRENV_01770 [Candidatus Dormibacteria bacterium]